MTTDALTNHERELIPYLARGLESKRIATEFGVGWRTIEHDIRKLARKIPNPDGVTPKTLVTIWSVQHELRKAE